MTDRKEDFEEAERFKPGTHGCHEALHMASFFINAIDDALLIHPAVKMNPAWTQLVQEAQDKLYDLYQAIGREHL